MSLIDPRAIIDPTATLADDVQVGPWSIIGAHVEIGAGSVIGPHVIIEGRTRIGADNRLHPFSVIGGEPQDKKYKGEDTALEIGDRLYWLSTGAYTASYSSIEFNGFPPLPTYYL